MDNNNKKFGLAVDTIQKINNVFQLYPEISKVILYGSRAKGNWHPGSDIDLSIVCNKKTNPSILLKIDGNLDDLMLPYKIDISLLKQINNPDLIDHINRVGKIFYSKDSNDTYI